MPNETKFAVNDYRSITVTCTHKQWNEHIIQEHEIMSRNEKAVKDTLKDPDTVYRSSRSEKREVYYKYSNFSTYSANTAVVVEFRSGINNPEKLVGDLITAFPAKKVGGGVRDVVYTKKQD